MDAERSFSTVATRLLLQLSERESNSTIPIKAREAYKKLNDSLEQIRDKARGISIPNDEESKGIKEALWYFLDRRLIVVQTDHREARDLAIWDSADGSYSKAEERNRHTASNELRERIHVGREEDRKILDKALREYLNRH